MTSIERIVAAGRIAFPDIAVSVEAIAPLIRHRLEGEESPELLAADEIYLACACAIPDGSAIMAFERRYFSVIPAALSRLALARDEISEIEQQLRIRLFVADGSDAPRVVTYAGQGQLGGLVRVAAIRLGLSLLRHRGKLEVDSDGFEQLPIADDDPALACLKALHRTAFRSAFEEAISELLPRERSLLNLALVKNLSIDRIGAIYGVHRATAARWVAAARSSLADGVHRTLGIKLGVSPAELGDLLPLVESQLELSLERLLHSR